MRRFWSDLRKLKKILKDTNRKADPMKNINDAMAMKALWDGQRICYGHGCPGLWFQMQEDGTIRDNKGNRRVLGFGDNDRGWDIVREDTVDAILTTVCGCNQGIKVKSPPPTIIMMPILDRRNGGMGGREFELQSVDRNTAFYVERQSK